MIKKKGGKQKSIPPKIISTLHEETSSSPAVHPNATLIPDASLESTSSQWLSRDSTNAPKIGEPTKEQEPFAESHAALIDKYVLSRHSIYFILVMGIIGYVFVQDNGAGKLTSWQGIWWTIQKSGILLGLLFFILLCQYLYNKFSGRN